MQLIPAAARFHADHGGVQAYFLFSFAHHVDPDNLGFGVLRAFNDEELAPRAGFALHPHTELEIVTIVLDGTLTQQDAAGQTTTTGAGDVHRLTAGTGMQHQEVNRDRTPLHRYQLWFRPSQPGLQPAQETRTLDFLTRTGAWVPLVSGRGDGGGAALFMNCDATVWWANLTPGQALTYAAEDGRRLFVYVAAGSPVLNGQQLEPNGQVRLSSQTHLTLAATEPAAVVLVDMP